MNAAGRLTHIMIGESGAPENCRERKFDFRQKREKMFRSA